MPRTQREDDQTLDKIANAFMKKLSEGMKNQDNLPSISWDQADSSLLTAAVVSATEGGASLLFGKTSDGGALTLIIYGGTKPVKYYPVTVSGVNAMLDAIAATDITPEAGKR